MFHYLFVFLLCFVNQARLKMSKWSKKEQDARINDLLEQLGLMKCQHAMIGIPGVRKGLSGGERKRLSFASQVQLNGAVYPLYYPSPPPTSHPFRLKLNPHSYDFDYYSEIGLFFLRFFSSVH